MTYSSSSSHAVGLRLNSLIQQISKTLAIAMTLQFSHEIGLDERNIEVLGVSIIISFVLFWVTDLVSRSIKDETNPTYHLFKWLSAMLEVSASITSVVLMRVFNKTIQPRIQNENTAIILFVQQFMVVALVLGVLFWINSVFVSRDPYIKRDIDEEIEREESQNEELFEATEATEAADTATT